MLIMLITPALAHYDEEAHRREYKIKAAFIYNFLKGVEWPQEVFADPNIPIKVGIIGRELFGEAFDPIKNKSVKGRKVIIRKLIGPSQITDSNNPLESLDVKEIKSFHLLFICASESQYLDGILNLVRDKPVLTISEIDGFMQAGGIINFVPDTPKAIFEVNLIASERAKLVISSKLLRIADKVIENKKSNK